MFPLTAKIKGSNRFAPAGAYRENPRVLPKLLRRPFRFFIRLMQGDISIPKHAEAALSGAVIGGAIVYGSLIGGQFETALNSVSGKMGFAVKEIEIAGNTYTQAGDVFTALQLEGGRSLLTIDPAEARNALRQLPWVGEARIAKVYPDKLHVDLTERDAFAVWQQGEALTVVEQDGSVIGGYAADKNLAALPLLVGKDAAKNGAGFIEKVAGFDDIAGRVRAYIRVGTRRWDLRLDNGMTVRLPENDFMAALNRLTQMQAELNILDRDLAAIDLRMPDRTVFALTDNARASRDAFVKARAEAAKKQRKARGSRI